MSKHGQRLKNGELRQVSYMEDFNGVKWSQLQTTQVDDAIDI